MSFQSQYSPRAILDGQKQTTTALPIVGATVNTNAIDLEMVNTFPALDQVNFLAITGAATANSGNSAVLSVQLQHSATNVSANFVNVPGTSAVNIASSGALYPATTVALPFPSNGVLEFVRLQVVQSAGGSNAANAANVTFALAF